uniref:Uncharacterized protein n=1 Tax=Arundo donax TaxID=35708 RepID=A0A0A8Z3S4_ARUDO
MGPGATVDDGGTRVPQIAGIRAQAGSSVQKFQWAPTKFLLR